MGRDKARVRCEGVAIYSIGKIWSLRFDHWRDRGCPGELVGAGWEATLRLLTAEGDGEIHPGLPGYNASHAFQLTGLSQTGFLVLFLSPFWVPLSIWSDFVKLEQHIQGRFCGERVWLRIFAGTSFLTAKYCTEEKRWGFSTLLIRREVVLSDETIMKIRKQFNCLKTA